MRINPVISYGQNSYDKCCKPRKGTGQNVQQNQKQNVSFGYFYDDRARDAAKDLVGSNIAYTVYAGDSKFLCVYHGWDEKTRKYILKAELDSDYLNSKDDRVQTCVKRLAKQAAESEYLDYEVDKKTGEVKFTDVNSDGELGAIANLAYQLRPYEQYDYVYPYVRQDAYYQRHKIN